MSKLKFCQVTPQGKSAIASIIVVGENAIQLAPAVFRPRNRKVVIENEFGRVVYGNWISENRLGEDLIVCPISCNHFEIHCHGSLAAIDIIIQTLQSHDAIRITQHELAGELFGSRYFGEIQLAISQARTVKIARLLTRQSVIHQEFWKQVVKRIQTHQVEQAQQQLDHFLDWKSFGLKLTSVFRIVFCGRPNVGKSSLVNAILGFQRAIVHEQAGTTRDVVHASTAIDGWPIELSDTAGFRESPDPVEQQGMELALESMNAADLSILVFDLTRFATDSYDQELQNEIQMFEPDMVVGNKMDLTEVRLDQVEIHVSAATQMNLDELMRIVIGRLVPNLPEQHQAIPLSESQVELALEIKSATEVGKLQEAIQRIESVLGSGTDR